MSKPARIILITALLLFFAVLIVRSQSPPVTLLTAPAGSTLTNCGTPTLPSVCVVASGVYVWQSSTSGWFLISPSAPAGVTSWNGQTGAVTYTAPVASVNGKTGAVVLGATATAPTVTLQ